jgi:cysteine-rich repeat protein
VAAGNRLLVTFAMDPASGTVSCADTRGNVYAIDADVTNGSGTSGVRAVVLSAPVATALVGGDVITITHPSLDARAMSVSEFSGLGARDRSATATGNGTAASAGPTAATAHPAELVLGAVGAETKKSEPLAPGAGFTALAGSSTGNNGSTTSNMSIDEEYRVVNATGTFTADGTLAQPRNWAMAVVTYAATCGDGVIESGEQCDDGNTQDGDCCSSSCQFETAGNGLQGVGRCLRPRRDVHRVERDVPGRREEHRRVPSGGRRVRRGGELRRREQQLPRRRAAARGHRMPGVGGRVRPGGDVHRLERGVSSRREEHRRLSIRRGRVRRGGEL